MKKLEQIKLIAQGFRKTGYYESAIKILEFVAERKISTQKLKNILLLYEEMERYNVSLEELKNECVFVDKQPAAFDLLVYGKRVPFNTSLKDKAVGIFPFAESHQMLDLNDWSWEFDRTVEQAAKTHILCFSHQIGDRISVPSLHFWKRIRSILNDLNEHLVALGKDPIDGHYFYADKLGNMDIFRFDDKEIEYRVCDLIFNSSPLTMKGYGAKLRFIKSVRVPTKQILL